MSNNTTKPTSDYDSTLIFQKAYNPTEGTIAVGGFVAGKLGHRVERTIISSTIDDFTYYDNSLLLYTIRVTYDGASHTNVNTVERTV